MTEINENMTIKQYVKALDERDAQIAEENHQTWLRWGKTVLGIVVVLTATTTVFGIIAPNYHGPLIGIIMLCAITVGWVGEFVTRPSTKTNLQA
jgi:hypothetical protein